MFHRASATALLVIVTAAGVSAQQASGWAERSPRASEPPVVRDAAWPQGPIDAFVLHGIEQAGERPSPAADARTLVRRLAFDLTGLAPSRELVARFVRQSSGDSSDQAYERLVDELLASPHYAERMAMYWLDLVRFADTTGVHADNPWDIYPYRDWVIRAFADNMPFDQFTVEQLAGDLLPEPTRSQKIAAAYNRLNLITREGGSQPKEFIARYMADRVRNVSTVWLAATVGCAECHDHKFDPIPTKDFYRLGAFFADIQQVGVYSQGAAMGRYFGPYIEVPSEQQEAELAALDQKLAAVAGELASDTDALQQAQAKWEQQMRAEPPAPPAFGNWHASGPYKGGGFAKVHKTEFGPERGVDVTEQVDGEPRWTEHPEWGDAKVHKLVGDHSAYYLYRTIDVTRAQRVTLRFGSDDSIRVWLDGELLLDKPVTRGVAPDQERLDVDLAEGQRELLVKISNGTGGFGFYFRSEFVQLPKDVLQHLRVPLAERTDAARARVAAYHRGVTPLLADARAQKAALAKRRKGMVAQFPVCMATVATKPATTRVLRRGDWMDDGGQVVEPGVPGAFGSLPKLDRRATRLDLANWLVQADNPRVARVFANRLWMRFFGRGIARSLDDFGSQGVAPTHPELLDWLARRFVTSGWNVRALVRDMVTSATYRQSSACGPARHNVDPYNARFSRQARYRHDAEVVRDSALAVSGLLVRDLYGRSAKPYQPTGFYQHLNFPKRRYQQDKGDMLWRRGIYTHWQRQYLHPAMAAFDAPSREECTVERARSNTPLQALVLLNDPIMVEAARVLATRALHEVGSDRLRWLFGEVLQRVPTARERDVLTKHLDKLIEQYAGDLDAARALLAIGEHPAAADLEPRTLAAWTGVARVLLSLHETLTRN